jgi:thiamine biosynthesis protein ThiS
VSNFTFVEIVLNGERQTVPEGQSVTQLLESLGVEPSRVAVELNRQILRKNDWSTTRVSGGDEVEVVHFVGGG